MEPIRHPSGPNADRAALLHVLSGHTKGVQCCAFDTAGRLLATGSDDTHVRVWSVETGALLHDLAGHTAGVAACVFLPRSQVLVTTSWDWTMRLWRLAEGAETSSDEVYHAAPLLACAVDRAGRMLATGDERNVCLWDLGRDLGQDLGNTQTSAGSAPEPSETLAPAAQILCGHEAAVRVCVFSPDGQSLASGADDGSVRLWRVADGAQSLSLSLPGAVRALAFSPEGEQLLGAASDGTLLWWSTHDGGVLRQAARMLGDVESCAFSPDLRRITFSQDDGTVLVWDLASSQARILGSHDDAATCCVWSPTGEQLATASWDGSARIWHME